MADTQVAVVSPDAAMARALAIIEQNKDCVSFVRREDLETSPLFVPVVSVIKPTREDFYDPIPQIGLMAKPPLVNLMKEKAGINILRTETSKRDEFVWVAHAFGEKRQPDGTMIQGDASYEFNVDVRAELDFLNQPGKYNTDIAKRKHILDMAKSGESRAITGAQHALIFKLAHITRAFKSPAELERGMILLRIDLNTKDMLASPEMREAVIAHAVGATRDLFGPGYGNTPERNVTPAEPIEPTEAPLGGESADVDPFDEPAQPTDAVTPQEPTPEQRAWAEARERLEEWAACDLIQRHPRACPKVTAMLANPDATLAEMTELIGLCVALQDWAKARAKGGGS